MKVHGTEIPAVVKQNNKGLPAADTVINQHRNIQGPAQPSEREVRDETNNEVRPAEESLDSVKSEMEDVGGQTQAQAHMYRRNTMEMQHPGGGGGGGGGGYIMGVPGNVTSSHLLMRLIISPQVNNILPYIPCSSRFRTIGSQVTLKFSNRHHQIRRTNAQIISSNSLEINNFYVIEN